MAVFDFEKYEGIRVSRPNRDGLKSGNTLLSLNRSYLNFNFY